MPTDPSGIAPSMWSRFVDWLLPPHVCGQDCAYFGHDLAMWYEQEAERECR